MILKIPITKKEKIKKEILKRTRMPKQGWLDITDGINLKFDPYLLASAMTAILEDFYKKGVRDVDILVTCEASGNVLATLGVLALEQLGMTSKKPFALTFRKTESDEEPMFKLFHPTRSASHGNRKKNISTRQDFLTEKRVLMIDDVLRDGETAAAIKKMTEKVGGTFLGLGVIFRKIWLKDKQLKNLPSMPIISLIEVASPSPEKFEELKRELRIKNLEFKTKNTLTLNP